MRALPILLALIVCGAHASTERIAPANVSRLEVAWVYDTGDSTEALSPGADRPAFEATPVYSDGTLYLSTPLGTVAALDAETGRQLWKVDLQIPYHSSKNAGIFLNRKTFPLSLVGPTTIWPLPIISWVNIRTRSIIWQRRARFFKNSATQDF